jgi:hypothetical protein
MNPVFSQYYKFSPDTKNSIISNLISDEDLIMFSPILALQMTLAFRPRCEYTFEEQYLSELSEKFIYNNSICMYLRREIDFHTMIEINEQLDEQLRMAAQCSQLNGIDEEPVLELPLNEDYVAPVVPVAAPVAPRRRIHRIKRYRAPAEPIQRETQCVDRVRFPGIHQDLARIKDSIREMQDNFKYDQVFDHSTVNDACVGIKKSLYELEELKRNEEEVEMILSQYLSETDSIMRIVEDNENRFFSPANLMHRVSPLVLSHINHNMDSIVRRIIDNSVPELFLKDVASTIEDNYSLDMNRFHLYMVDRITQWNSNEKRLSKLEIMLYFVCEYVEKKSLEYNKTRELMISLFEGHMGYIQGVDMEEEKNKWIAANKEADVVGNVRLIQSMTTRLLISVSDYGKNDQVLRRLNKILI